MKNLLIFHYDYFLIFFVDCLTGLQRVLEVQVFNLIFLCKYFSLYDHIEFKDNGTQTSASTMQSFWYIMVFAGKKTLHLRKVTGGEEEA